jgi:hypothetical protein
MGSSGLRGAACFETRAFRALLSMRSAKAIHRPLILRSGPQDRVSKDAKRAPLAFLLER